MDRAWKHFSNDSPRDTERYHGPSDADVEQADDKAYAADFNVLLAIFRTTLTNDRPVTRQTFAIQLRLVASQMLDGWGSSDAQFPQQAFDDHGPAIILRALAKAYVDPAHVVVNDIEHP